MTAASAEDGAVVDRWWRHLVATGRVPDELQPVQTRLVRSVHRGHLPSGEVYVKAMTFPRVKDRLRYLLRRLPAAHEARALRVLAAADIPCPEVVCARTTRRFLLPHRSMLVLRALPVAAGPEDLGRRLRDEAELGMRLLAAGVEHRDLNAGNFVRLDDRRLAVLDLQSARLRSGPCAGSRQRAMVAARLLREHAALPRDLVGRALRESGVARDAAELDAALARAKDEHRAWLRSRVLRCLEESTEYTRLVGWSGVEHRLRSATPGGAWHRGGRDLVRCWIGQRAMQVFEGREPLFMALRRRWWWLGGGTALLVPPGCSPERIAAELAVASAAWRTHAAALSLR